MHGGSVSVTCPGIGSIFEIRLPLIKRDQSELAGKSLAGAAVSSRTLIVDDNVDGADALKLLLKFCGHQVESAYSARAALDHMRSFKPDFVLLDIGLPEIDGYELARRIRSFPDLANVRLIAISGYGRDEDKQRAQAAGFGGYLTKPVELSALQRSLAVLQN